MKRIVLFLITNLAVMLVLSASMNILGVGRYLNAQGLDLTQLLIFSALVGFTGAIISLLMSKWMAKQSVNARVIDPNAPANAEEAWLVDTVHQLADRAGIGRPEVAIYEGEPNAFATGRNMQHWYLNLGYEVEDVAGMVRLVYQNRVRFHDGDAELAPGLSVHRLGGHTDGTQCVRVWTQRGWVVLASDSAHYYEHFHDSRLFIGTFNAGAAIQAYRRLRELAGGSLRHIVPGHDPMVMERYPAAAGLEGIAVRLDAEPSA